MNTAAENLEFRYLTPDWQSRIVALRHECYSEQYGSQVDLSGLNWIPADQQSIHLGVLQGTELVSALRLSIYRSQDRLEKTILFPTPTHLKFPIALLARAATKKSHSSLQLHNKLRLIALETCLHFNIFTVLGSLEEKSLRLPSLQQFGYKIYNSQPAWKGSYLKSTGPVVLIGLESKNEIELAIRKMRDRYKFEVHLTPPETMSLL